VLGKGNAISEATKIKKPTKVGPMNKMKVLSKIKLWCEVGNCVWKLKNKAIKKGFTNSCKSQINRW
jgi:hypothetical protein